MKLAWIAVSGPESLVGGAMSRLEVIADTYLSMNTPIQLAAPVLLEQRHSICEQLRKRVRLNRQELDGQLAGQKLASRLEIQGGWYAVLRIPAVRSDEEFAIALLEQQGILVQPGYFYDFPDDGYLVLSLITREEEFREGTRRLLQAVA
jgi:aspartate/methionine/tyrosine aminotransferase